MKPCAGQRLGCSYCLFVVLAWVLPSAASQWLVAPGALLLAQAVCSASLVDRYLLQAGSLAGAFQGSQGVCAVGHQAL